MSGYELCSAMEFLDPHRKLMAMTTKIKDTDTGAPVESIEGCISLVAAVVAPKRHSNDKEVDSSFFNVGKEWLEVAANILNLDEQAVKEAWQKNFER